MDLKTDQHGNSPPITMNDSRLLTRFQTVRKQTEDICDPLEIEDFVVQPIVDVSPPKWHLAHTTWFFEELILKKYFPGYEVYEEQFNFLFNSYYESVGERTLRPDRGNMTRPTVKEILDYRKHVNVRMKAFLEANQISQELNELIILGLNHEQQHQELLVTDLKYILGHNPLFPVYSESDHSQKVLFEEGTKEEWLDIKEGVYSIGFEGDGFHFDNELGRHKVYIHDCQLMGRLVTCGEYMDFMEDGGYEDFKWWLSEGWDWVNANDVKAPLYWHRIDGSWKQYTLGGLKTIDREAPITHISFYEADAYGQWKGLRLPTEFEWEVAASNFSNSPESGTFLEDKLFHPIKRPGNSSQFLGDVWEWTNSAYLPYPYFSKAPGAVGEYNGKFMINQKVLRGGSCATARDHIRLSYRNFFQPQLRWQFTGLRLARTLKK